MDLSRLQLRPHKLFHHLDEVIKWRNGEYFPPIFVEFSPTDRCNQKCWYCYADYLKCSGPEIEMDADKLVSVFREMGQAGVKSVMVQGMGEPLMHKAMSDAFVEGKKAGLSQSLCTNGVLLGNSILEKIMPILEWIRVSDVEHTPELYAKSHGCSTKHWHIVTENIRHAVTIRNRDNLDVVLGMQMPIFEYNVPYIVETTELMKSLGLDYIALKPAGQSIHNPTHIWRRDIHQQYSELLKKVKEYEDENFLVSVRDDQFLSQEGEMGHGGFKKNFDKCYAFAFEAMIYSDGGLYPCLHFWRDPEYCYGNLFENTFEEIWQSKQRKQVLNKIYNHFDLNDCSVCCKDAHLNEELHKLSHPPMHVNFL